MTQTTDLNERVQVRLAELAGLAESSGIEPKDSIGTAVWTSPKFGNLMVESWRERWERHKPIAWAHGYSVLKDCKTCGQAMVGKGRMCPDALSVLREIGIEP